MECEDVIAKPFIEFIRLSQIIFSEGRKSL